MRRILDFIGKLKRFLWKIVGEPWQNLKMCKPRYPAEKKGWGLWVCAGEGYLEKKERY